MSEGVFVKEQIDKFFLFNAFFATANAPVEGSSRASGLFFYGCLLPFDTPPGQQDGGALIWAKGGKKTSSVCTAGFQSWNE